MTAYIENINFKRTIELVNEFLQIPGYSQHTKLIQFLYNQQQIIEHLKF